MKTCLLIMSLLCNAFLLGSAFWPPESHLIGFKVKKVGRFSIMTKDATTNAYVVAFDDGRYFWTINGNNQTINCGIWASVTAFFDPTNNRINKMLLEFRGVDGRSVYLTDVNGDGIVDQRRNGNDPPEYFVGGDFYQSAKDGTHKYIYENGAKIEIQFVNGRWTTKEH